MTKKKKMIVDDNILKAIFPQSTAENRTKYLPGLNLTLIRYNMDNAPRVMAFLATIGHESGQLKYVVENLNYSAAGLMKTWPARFPTEATANEYARNPEKIANNVYAGRMGNTSPGDGWKYRGRGLIQLTGKSNYSLATEEMYSLPLGVDFVLEPELIATPEYATQSAGWFWYRNGLNELADKLTTANEYEAFKVIVKKVNGGTIGLEDRWKLYQNAKKVIS